MLKNALGAYRGSVREITRLIDAEPDNADAYFRRAGVREAAGDIEGALKDLDMALKLGLPFRDCIAAYGNRGLIRHDIGDYRGAEEDFTAVIERKPRHKGLMKAALIKRAASREKLGEVEGAAADRRLAVLLSPDHEQTSQQGE